MNRATLDGPPEESPAAAVHTQAADQDEDPSAAGTMTAIVQSDYGSNPEDVLQVAAVAKPTAGDGQILVRVRAASVDRGTWHLMTGLPYAMRLAGFGLRAPKAPTTSSTTAARTPPSVSVTTTPSSTPAATVDSHTFGA